MFNIMRVLVLSIGLLSTNAASPEMPPKVVEVQKATPTTIRKTVRLVGTLKAERQNVLTARVPGVLDQVAPAGSILKKGQVVARIENEQLSRSVELAKDSEKIALAQKKRIEKLLSAKYASKLTLEERKQKVLEAQQQLARTTIDLDQSQFKAPFDGIVGPYKKREGEMVSVGDVILTFYDPQGMIVEFDIPAQYVVFLKDNQAVDIRGKTFSLGKAQYIVDEETYMSPAYVPVKGLAGYVGELVDVDLILEEKKSAIVIPFQAVIRRDNGDFVYVVKDNKSSLTPVTLGIRERENVEIEKGLKSGDLVIVENPERLFPEMSVSIAKPPHVPQAAHKK